MERHINNTLMFSSIILYKQTNCLENKIVIHKNKINIIYAKDKTNM